MTDQPTPEPGPPVTPAGGVPRLPATLPLEYPVSADLARLRNGHVPTGSNLVRITILLVVLVMAGAMLGLFIAWKDADSEADLASDQLNCPRASAVRFDSALGQAVQAKLRLDIRIANALVAVGRGEQDDLAAALIDVQEQIAFAEAADAAIEVAVELRNQSLDLCDGDGSSPTASSGG